MLINHNQFHPKTPPSNADSLDESLVLPHKMAPHPRKQSSGPHSLDEREQKESYNGIDSQIYVIIPSFAHNHKGQSV